MPVRGIRGAITVDKNEKGAIINATGELLEALIHRNGIDKATVAAVFFTVTTDLDSAFPAAAARQLGWQHVPLLCANEIPVPGGVPRCIRILILINTDAAQEEIQHVYLKDAAALRPDLSGSSAAEMLE